MEGYFVVKSTADGLTFHGPLSSKELEKRLDEGYYGETTPHFLDRVPPVDGFCLSMREDALLIIKGEIVRPIPVERQVAWKVPT